MIHFCHSPRSKWIWSNEILSSNQFHRPNTMANNAFHIQDMAPIEICEFFQVFFIVLFYLLLISKFSWLKKERKITH